MTSAPPMSKKSTFSTPSKGERVLKITLKGPHRLMFSCAERSRLRLILRHDPDEQLCLIQRAQTIAAFEPNSLAMPYNVKSQIAKGFDLGHRIKPGLEQLLTTPDGGKRLDLLKEGAKEFFDNFGTEECGYCPEDLIMSRGDDIFVLVAFGCLDEHWPTDKKMALLLLELRIEGIFLRLSKVLQRDADVIKATVEYDSSALTSRGSDLTLPHNNRATVLAAVKACGQVLRFASVPLRDDREVVLAALAKNHYYNDYDDHDDILEFASARLQDDEEVVFAAVTRPMLEYEGFKSALSSASARLQDERRIVLEAVMRDGAALEYVSTRLSDDRSVALAAVKQSGKALEFVSNNLKDDPIMVLRAILNSGDIRHASLRLRHEPLFRDLGNLLKGTPFGPSRFPSRKGQGISTLVVHLLRSMLAEGEEKGNGTPCTSAEHVATLLDIQKNLCDMLQMTQTGKPDQTE